VLEVLYHHATVILKADRKTAQTRRPHFVRSCVDSRGLCGRVEVHWAETAHNADRLTAQTIL